MSWGAVTDAVIQGTQGANVFSYGDFNGQITSNKGSASLMGFGSAANATVSGALDAFAMPSWA